MTEKVKPAPKPKAATKPAAKPATAVSVKQEPEKVAGKPKTSEKVVAVDPTEKIAKVDKPKKQKMVRDSFTMPQDDYAHFAALKARCLKAGLSVKKSEVLRAALMVMSQLSDKALLAAMNKLETIKTGRPSKA